MTDGCLATSERRRTAKQMEDFTTQKKGRKETVNCKLLTVNCKLLTVNCKLLTVNCKLLTVNC